MRMLTAVSDLDYLEQIGVREEQEPEHCPRCGDDICDCACGYCLDADEERE